MANRTFYPAQALEKQIKSIFTRAIYSPTFAAARLLTTTPIDLVKVPAGSLINGRTLTLQVAAAAANPTDTVLALFNGSAAATVCTITPNNGTNNPTTQSSGSLATTTPIVLTEVALLGVLGNGKTFTVQVAAAAANPAATVLAVFTGNANAITVTITPNDGTNNAATPVDLTTAELVELINSGLVVGKTITLTDAGALRDNQTAAGGDATPLADAGEGDNVSALFANGVNTPVGLTTAELVELIQSGAVFGKTVTITDVGNLRDDQTASGGGAELLADGGEGDGLVATFTGAIDFTYESKMGVVGIAQLAVGKYRLTLEDRYSSLKNFNPIIIDTTERDFTFQVSALDVNPTSGEPYIDFFVLTSGVATDLPATTKVMVSIKLKNTDLR